MLPTWVMPVITIAGMIFSSGVTWGVIKYKQRHTDDTQKDVVNDLKECVNKLQDVVTDVKIMKIAGERNERQIADHDRRIVDIEIQISKPSKRKR